MWGRGGFANLWTICKVCNAVINRYEWLLYLTVGIKIFQFEPTLTNFGGFILIEAGVGQNIDKGKKFSVISQRLHSRTLLENLLGFRWSQWHEGCWPKRKEIHFLNNQTQVHVGRNTISTTYVSLWCTFIKRTILSRRSDCVNVTRNKSSQLKCG